MINFVSGFDEGMYFWEVTWIQKLSSIHSGFQDLVHRKSTVAKTKIFKKNMYH